VKTKLTIGLLLVSLASWAGIYSPSSGSGGANTGITNFTEVLLFTNKTAYVNGQWYSWPNSTSAGWNELQALFGQPANANASGLMVKHQSGTYTFTLPFNITNNVMLDGPGYASCRYLYVGPTNLWTVQRMMTNPLTAGLITFVTNATPIVGFGVPMLPNVEIRGISFSTASNFPCALLDGQINNLYMDKWGLFGPDVTNLQVIVPVISPVNSGVVGFYGDVYAQMTVRNGWANELADGFYINCKDSYNTFEDNVVAYCGLKAGNINGTQYPSTNVLSLGFGIGGYGSTYRFVANHNAPVSNYLSYFFNSLTGVEISETTEQSSIYSIGLYLAGCENRTGMSQFAVTNGGANGWAVDAVAADLNTLNSGAAEDFSEVNDFYVDDTYHWDNNNVQVFGFKGLATGPPSFTINGLFPLTANGIGLTNMVSAIQAGHTNVSAATSVVINFKTAWPNTNYTVIATAGGTTGFAFSEAAKTTTNCTLNFLTLSASIDWVATHWTQ